VNKFLRYLGSAKNIAGCTLGLLGLLLHFAGLLGIFWPLVVAALYVIGALVAPPPRHAPAMLAGLDVEEIRRALDRAYRMTSGRLPADVQAKVGEIRQEILDLLPHAADFPGDSQDLFVLQRTATDYLPTTLEAYLALPTTYATRRVVQDGKTPLQVLKDQLELLDAKMDEIGDAVHRQDSDRLLVQGRFLEERFGHPSGGLTLPPANP
jgi:hypothetical protein